MKDIHIVIMAGGVGSRLYPVSTPEHPKQFIDLLDCGRTLIQLTYERFLKVNPDARFWVVTSARYIHFINEQLPDIPAEQILAEPEPRSTAPCIAYACWKIRKKYPSANIIVTPSDAYVPDCEAFARTMRAALGFTATRHAIVCVGITPTSPHTGYGYIHAAGDADGVVKVSEFKEKPSAEVAEKYLAEGGYYWNAGIFVWNAQTIEEELRVHAPQICGVMDELAPALYSAREEEELERLFPTCEKISIDYAVMEKSADVYMIPGPWAWSDLGSFEAIEAITGKKLK
ncbi:MAG: mannose-1-phosphate guanylyltransferase [Bacteroidia bacterium]|nr:mannose-1-phosphate guanylyltransferase [Bacteroidia bacterium]